MVSAYGPQEPSRRSDQQSNDLGYLTCDVINAPYSGNERKKHKSSDKRAFDIENVVKQTFETVVMLELYPKSEIYITINILEADGSVICSVLNAITLALMDAGISMKGLISSCSVGLVKDDIYYDVTQLETNSCSAYLPVATRANSNDIVFMQLNNRIPAEKLPEVLAHAQESCKQIHDLLCEFIQLHLMETYKGES